MPLQNLDFGGEINKGIQSKRYPSPDKVQESSGDFLVV